jgi:hypothetical protein
LQPKPQVAAEIIILQKVYRNSHQPTQRPDEFRETESQELQRIILQNTPLEGAGLSNGVYLITHYLYYTNMNFIFSFSNKMELLNLFRAGRGLGIEARKSIIKDVV